MALPCLFHLPWSQDKWDWIWRSGRSVVLSVQVCMCQKLIEATVPLLQITAALSKEEGRKGLQPIHHQFCLLLSFSLLKPSDKGACQLLSAAKLNQLPAESLHAVSSAFAAWHWQYLLDELAYIEKSLSHMVFYFL